MTSKYTNKNGVKLLAAIAVFALVFAGAATIFSAEESDADTYANAISFTGNVAYGDPYGTTSNIALKNSLQVYYNENTATYTLYGYIAEQDFNSKDFETSAFYKLWEGNTECKYGIAFNITTEAGITVKVGDGDESTTSGTTEPCLLYISGIKDKPVDVVVDSITYKLNISNLNTISVADLGKRDIISGATSTTISLSKDAYITDPILNPSGDVTINLNGHNLLAGCRVVSMDNKDTRTQNVTITAGNGGSIDGCDSIILGYSDGKLTITGGTYNSPTDYAIVWYGNDYNKDTTVGEGAELTDVNVNASVGLWFSNGAQKEVKLDNCVVETSSLSVYMATVQKATITNCTISSQNSTALEIKAGTIDIVGGSLDSGAFIKADGTIGNNGSGSGKATLNINNGYQRIADPNGNVIVTIDGVNITNTAGIPIQLCAGVYNSGTSSKPVETMCPGNITLNTDDSVDIFDIAITQHAPKDTTDNRKIEINIEEAKTDVVIVDDNDAIKNNAESGDLLVLDIGTKTDATVSDVELKNGTSLVISGDNTSKISLSNVKIDATSTVVFNSKGSITASITIEKNSASFKDVKGQFSISKGSIYVIGDITAGEITLGADDVLELNGSITNATIKYAGAADKSATVMIKDGDKLNLTGTLTLESGIKMTNDGEIVGNGTIVVPDGAQFYTSNPVSVSFSGAGKIVLEDAMETLKLSDKLASSLTTEPTQKVIIIGNLTIKSGQTLRIQGDLEIPEGVTVTIENGGKLVIDGPTATALVAGSIKAVGQFSVLDTAADGITVDGTISAEGNNSVVIDAITNLNGIISINSKGTATFTSGLYVYDEGTVDVKGTVSGSIYNMGTVTVNGSVDSTTVYMNSVDAVVTIEAIKSGTLTVSDEGLYLKTVNTDRKYVGGTSTAAPTWTINVNSVQFTNVKGITVTEGITYRTVNDERNPYNYMYIEGTTGVADSKNVTAPNAPAIVVATGKITVSGELTISKVAFTVSSGATLAVSGNVTVTDDEGTTFTGASDTAKITVSGLIRTVDYEIDTESDVTMSAVKYSKKVDTKTEYYYTNLADAIASGEKDLTVLGNISILKDTTVPKGISIDASDSKVTVGGEDYKTVTLTVADGGYLESKTVDVIGTFYIENIETGVDKLSNITSDTSVITEKTAMYTNLVNALGNAESGEVRITKTGDGIVSLTEDATVKAGVTLVIPNGKKLSIMNGVTLAVAGTLDNKGTIVSEKVANAAVGVVDNGFGPAVKNANAATADADKLYSVISVTGTIISSTALKYGADFSTATDDYNIVGAYYEAKGKYYITTVEQAAGSILSADGYKVELYGKNKVGTVAFDGTADKTVSVDVYGDVAAESLTVKFGQVTFKTADKTIDGTFGSSVGTITVSNMKIKTTMTIIDSVVTIDEQDVQKVTIAGSIETADMKIAPSVVFNGNVEISTDLTVKATCDASAGNYGLVSVDSDAVVTVSKNGVEFDVTDVLTVNGTLVSVNEGTVKAKTIEVLGVLDIKEKTEKTKAGAISVENLYVGGTIADVASVTIANTTAVNAPSTGVKAVYLFPGSTVSGELMTAMEKEDAKYTEFYVEDALWLTVYAINGNMTIAESVAGSDVYHFVPENIEEKKFLAWQFDDNGDMTNVAAGKKIGEIKSVTAKIQYQVYNVSIDVCEGIDDVYIDGILVTVYDFQVSAGTHTISYTLSNGYSGEATMLLNGDKVTGYKFTASGDFNKNVYNIILQGIEKSGYVPESPDVPTPVEPTEKDDSLGITEYLLIVLVILAAILVVVVAIRMMRS